MTRRELLLASAAAAAGSAAPAMPALCIFSKHLPQLKYDELGKTARQMGFDGVDLTVRDKGHVLPERAAQDLPLAYEAIRAHGVAVPMITTGLTAANGAARPTLETAGRLHVPFWKPGYWRYRPDASVEAVLESVKEAASALCAIGGANGIAMGLHNHSGTYVGAPVWDNREILAGLDPRWAGYYFDPCHATAEGGEGAWWTNLRLALPRLKMVAVKDFYWERSADKWRMRMCPLGQGMVDWPRFFGQLAAARFSGPVSLHLEYEARDELDAIARDLSFARSRLAAAYRG